MILQGRAVFLILAVAQLHRILVQGASESSLVSLCGLLSSKLPFIQLLGQKAALLSLAKSGFPFRSRLRV
jgi:hypothetical protein